MPIRVLPHDPAWATQFRALRDHLWPVVCDLATSIEHVGSTSVPGLAAKPILDLDIIVPTPHDVPATLAALATLGYTHLGDRGITGREAFQNPPDTPHPAHNLYVCPQGCPALVNHLAVRDHLRAHPDVAAAYGALKLDLARRFPDDIDAYIDGKTTLLLDILRDASGLGAETLDDIERANRLP